MPRSVPTSPKRFRQRVKDPKVADKLVPKDHGFGTRRVPLESGYFETYNRDNVTLMDTLVDEPIECITPRGIKTTRQEHEFDILVYATGFDGVTGAYDRIDIRGENGLRLKDAWAETPRTYLGMLAEGFPNMLMVLGPHTARGNIPQAISHSVEFQAGLLRFIQQHDYTRVATRPEQVDEWTRIVIKAGEALLSFQVDSWQNGVNRNVEGRTVRRVLGYNGNGAHFRRTTRPCKIVGGDHAAAAVGLRSLAGRKPGWRRRKACSSVSFSTAVRTSRKGCTVGLLQRICCALAMRQAIISSTALSTNEVAIGSPRRRRAA